MLSERNTPSHFPQELKIRVGRGSAASPRRSSPTPRAATPTGPSGAPACAPRGPQRAVPGADRSRRPRRPAHRGSPGATAPGARRRDASSPRRTCGTCSRPSSEWCRATPRPRARCAERASSTRRPHDGSARRGLSGPHPAPGLRRRRLVVDEASPGVRLGQPLRGHAQRGDGGDGAAAARSCSPTSRCTGSCWTTTARVVRRPERAGADRRCDRAAVLRDPGAAAQPRRGARKRRASAWSIDGGGGALRGDLRGLPSRRPAAARDDRRRRRLEPPRRRRASPTSSTCSAAATPRGARHRAHRRLGQPRAPSTRLPGAVLARDASTSRALDGALSRASVWQRFRLPEPRARACDVLFVPGGNARTASRSRWSRCRATCCPSSGASCAATALSCDDAPAAAAALRADAHLPARRRPDLPDALRAARPCSGGRAIPAPRRRSSRTASRSASAASRAPQRPLAACSDERSAARCSTSRSSTSTSTSGTSPRRSRELRARGAADRPRSRRARLPAGARAAASTRSRASIPAGASCATAAPCRSASCTRCTREAELFVFASSCENMPNILLEAMAAGLPIACSRARTDARGARRRRRLLRPGAAPTRSPPRCAGWREDADAARAPRARRARARALEYSWERCARETLAFIAEVGADAGARRRERP